MGSKRMSKFQKIGMSLSCFMPLYLILLFKNILGIINLHCIVGKAFNCKTFDFLFNIIMIIVWMILFFVGWGAIAKFQKLFLDKQNQSKEIVTINRAENITGEYGFTYFSIFILTFFAVDPTSWTDVVVMLDLMIFIIVIYYKNEMWHINPVLNFCGYKFFNVNYSKSNEKDDQHKIRVFSKDNLCMAVDEEYKISYSSYDFSVCYKNDTK